MKFIKDILFIDFEVTVGNLTRAEPTQIGAILIDKETLEEKETFSSYIAADLQGKVNQKSGITQEMLVGAPTQAEVGKIFFEKFGTDILLGSWVADLDRAMLRKLLSSAEIDSTQYDYHFIDLWPTAYIHLLKQGYEGAINSEPMFQALGIKPRERHDALADCRIAADILRKVMST